MRIDADIANTPPLGFLIEQLGSFLFFAAERLIERRRMTRQTRPRDEALIFMIPRLFNDCLAGYELARRGLVLQALVLLRSALEVETRAVWFLEDEGEAAKWLQGKKTKQMVVQAKSPFAKLQTDLYTELSALSHPNLDAVNTFSVPVTTAEGSGTAQAYGGGFFPKEAGLAILRFLHFEVAFLDAFYKVYEADLAEHGLLWRVDAAIIEGTEQLDWPQFLQFWTSMLDGLGKAYDARPDVDPGLSGILKMLAGRPTAL